MRFSYAVMSSHIHLLLVAGTSTFDFLIRRAHSGFARWLNRRQGRLGPVFAQRPDTIDVDLADSLAARASDEQHAVARRLADELTENSIGLTTFRVRSQRS
jgi:hypothetical protein